MDSNSGWGTGRDGAQAISCSGGVVGAVLVGVLVVVVAVGLLVVDVLVGVPVDPARTSIAATVGWFTDAVNARSSRPSETGTETSRTSAVIGAT